MSIPRGAPCSVGFTCAQVVLLPIEWPGRSGPLMAVTAADCTINAVGVGKWLELVVSVSIRGPPHHGDAI